MIYKEQFLEAWYLVYKPRSYSMLVCTYTLTKKSCINNNSFHVDTSSNEVMAADMLGNLRTVTVYLVI